MGIIEALLWLIGWESIKGDLKPRGTSRGCETVEEWLDRVDY